VPQRNRLPQAGAREPLVERTVAKSDTYPTHRRSSLPNIRCAKGLQLDHGRSDE